MVTDVRFRLLGDELRALRALKREAKSAFTFVSERGAPLHRALAGQSIPPAVGVASALRSSAGANKSDAAHRPSPMLDRPGGRLRLWSGKQSRPHLHRCRRSVSAQMGLTS